MRFYGLSDEQVMGLPIRKFWLMDRMIDRIRSEEILAWLPAHFSAMGGEHVPKTVEDLRRRVGRPSVVEQVRMTREDEEKLQRLFG